MAIPMPLLFLLLALAPLSYSAVFVNIDCGSSKSFTAPNKLEWIGDNSLIKNGESHQVEDISTTAPQELSTLRAFTTRNKNCYSIEAGKGGKVLVRARFYYGNYDKKSSPPTFELHFDSNYWATVETTADTVKLYEVIYVVKGDHTSICLAQTHPNQFPFISSLEVKSIDSKMFNHVDADYAMYCIHTVAYGTSKAIRYPDDPYDRYWTPEEVDNGYTAVTNDATSIKVGVPEKPPEAVLVNAVTSSSTSEPLILATQIRTGSSIPIYLIMYFSEVTQLDSDQKRSFVFCVDNDIASEPIVPPYGSVFELYLTNTTATPNTIFSLIATTDSTLPPLINAMELFFVLPLTDGTNSKDVEGLAILQSKFSVLKEWTGDPCLPSTFTWDWVNCSSDPVPRVTALYLNGYGLSGSLPDFSSLDALETIDFQNNSLTGAIPDFLGKFSNLKELNLADNNLGGSIPTSLSKKKELNLVISGNSELCSSSSNLCEKTKTKNSSGGSNIPSFASTNKQISDLPSIIVGATIFSFFVFF